MRVALWHRDQAKAKAKAKARGLGMPSGWGALVQTLDMIVSEILFFVRKTMTINIGCRLRVVVISWSRNRSMNVNHSGIGLGRFFNADLCDLLPLRWVCGLLLGDLLS